MDKKPRTDIGTYLIMALGFIIGGIGGAATVSELPDNWEKVKGKFGKKPNEEPASKE